MRPYVIYTPFFSLFLYICSSIHSFSKYSLSTSYMLDTVSCAESIAVTKVEKNTCPCEVPPSLTLLHTHGCPCCSGTFQAPSHLWSFVFVILSAWECSSPKHPHSLLLHFIYVLISHPQSLCLDYSIENSGYPHTILFSPLLLILITIWQTICLIPCFLCGSFH